MNLEHLLSEGMKKGPHGYIQWRGTDVCMDVHCKCGEISHIDSDFCYYVECPACHTIYSCNGNIELIEIDDEEDLGVFQPKIAQVQPL